MSFKKSFFITGTDTGVGKTTATIAIMKAFQQLDNLTIGFKPIASGCFESPNGFRNEDALQLQANSSSPVDYNLINPYAVKEPIAPHIAANQQKIDIHIDDILKKYQVLEQHCPSHFCFIEGCGGWRVPLNEKEYISQLALSLKLPVILVVGLRLGCISQALLTQEIIEKDGAHIVGWIGNFLENNMLAAEENINTLSKRITAPLLGIFPYDDNLNSDLFSKIININKIKNAY